MMFNPLGEIALPKKARTGKRWCEVCGEHRPRQRRQCQCCARYAGPGCMPQRCWTNDHMKLCRYCAHRFLLREIPDLEKSGKRSGNCGAFFLIEGSNRTVPYTRGNWLKQVLRFYLLYYIRRAYLLNKA